jgi:hypothetical protein
MWEISVVFRGKLMKFKSESEPYSDDGFVIFWDFETKRCHKFANCEVMVVGPEGD